MKSIIYFLASVIIISFSSCSGSSEKDDQKSVINISIDSAIVDAKGEIIDTKYGIYSFGFDDDKNFMYKFNTNNRHGLEIIDINKMELIDFIPFEIEGPNGTGSRVNMVNYISDKEIAITNFQSILIFDFNGKLIRKYAIDNHDFDGDTLSEDLLMESSGLFIPQNKLSFNLVNEGFGKSRGIAKLNLEENIREFYWIDELKKLDDYQISLTDDGKMVMMLRTYLYKTFQEDKFILSHDMENELFYYDLKVDSVIHKKYESQLSANLNEASGKTQTDSREELGKIVSERNKGIRFKDIVFDKKNNRYYRFSTYSTSTDPKEEKWNIILTVFDENLNMINETENVPLEELPKTYFVKDGKIYVYKNMEDEMGFLVLSLSNQVY
jgi:hypothetical protein